MRKLDWRNRACAAVLLWATAPIGLSAQTFKTLHSFDGTDGSAPFARLVQAAGGDLYGTTYVGGANGEGTVFKIVPSGGAVKTLYSFCSQGGTACTDGHLPLAELVQATGGNFYGTTAEGGGNGAGTVFKITPSGTLTTLHRFCFQPPCTDGTFPQAGLVQAAGGNFYGTTYSGGANNSGTVFKTTPNGTLTTLITLFAPKAAARTASTPSVRWPRPPMGTFTGQRLLAGPTRRAALDPAVARSSESLPVARSRPFTAFAPKAVARTARTPSRHLSRPPMGTSTAQRTTAGLTAMARSSKSLPVAR
jgi:uncharacterized repeat protein (TIGR03803 family)